MNPLRTLMLAFVLLALPLQGLAAYMPAMVCADSHGGHDGGHNHHAAAETAANHHHPDDSGSPEPANAHSCCHHVVSAGAPAAVPGIVETPRELATGVTSLATLFIPELPQRPPRA